MKDVPGVHSKLNVQVIGGEPVPPEATRLHEEARLAGGRGDYDRALELLNRAHQLAPTWLYPLYDAAFTHLLQGDSVKAEALYAEVDRRPRAGFSPARLRSIVCGANATAKSLPVFPRRLH